MTMTASASTERQDNSIDSSRQDRRRRRVEQEEERTTSLFQDVGTTYSSSRQQQQPLIISQIIGGTVTQPKQYPWLAALFAVPTDAEDPIYLCTGTLIAPSVVLSAAHCAFGDLVVNYITIGKYDLALMSSNTTTTAPGQGQGQGFAVTQTLVHPSYDDLSSESNDVALFFLDGVFQANPSTFSNYNFQLNADGVVPNDSAATKVKVLGYGVNDLVNAPNMPSKLAHEVVIETLSNTECQSRYGQSLIGESMLCAASPGKDACLGDSGGPLLLERYDSNGVFQQTLVGVVSWGYACADDFYPGVYARVSSSLDWITTEVCAFYPELCFTKNTRNAATNGSGALELLTLQQTIFNMNTTVTTNGADATTNGVYASSENGNTPSNTTITAVDVDSDSDSTMTIITIGGTRSGTRDTSVSATNASGGGPVPSLLTSQLAGVLIVASTLIACIAALVVVKRRSRARQFQPSTASHSNSISSPRSDARSGAFPSTTATTMRSKSKPKSKSSTDLLNSSSSRFRIHSRNHNSHQKLDDDSCVSVEEGRDE